MAGPRLYLLTLSVALAVLELVDGFRLDLPWAAWSYALLLLAGSLWLWRSSGPGPVVVLGALHLLELLMLVFVFRTGDQAPPAALWWLFVVFAAGGAVAAGWVLTSRRAVVQP